MRGGMEWIRSHYPVPAKRGGRIRFMGQPGRITSVSGGHLVIHLDADPPSRRRYVHPCWEMEYADATRAVGTTEPRQEDSNGAE